MTKQLLITALLLTSIGNKTFSQTPSLQSLYQNTTGAQNNEITSVENDVNGNTYFCGKFSDTFTLGSLTLPAGSGGVLIGKLDNAGNPVWLKQGGSPTPVSDAGYDVSVNQNGDVYVCGVIPGNQTAEFNGVQLAAGSTGFVVKYDNNGNFLWAQGYTSNIYAIAVDNNDIPVINSGDQTLFKLDPGNGNLVSSPSATISGNLQNPYLHNILVDVNNNIISQAGNKIIKFDNNFNQLWSTPVTPSVVAETFKINADAAGNIYGSFYGQFGTVTIGTIVKSNFPNGYIYQLDAASGTPNFVDSVMIGSSATKIKEIIADNGNYYLSGDGGFNTAAVAKVTPTYSVLWSVALSNNTPLADVSLVSDNCLFIAGNHTATTIIGPYTLTMPDPGMTSNSFISALCSGSVAIHENNNLANRLKIFPNPAMNIIHIEGSEKLEIITLTDIRGNEIELPVSDNSVDISTLDNGMYFIKALMNNRLISGRFVKN